MGETFSIQTGAYEGPLDVLLNLIEARKLSISQVSLADVCDAYLAYVEKLPELPLAETSQFILIASTLLLIKSRTLLPTVDLSPEEELSIEDLERRLARYRQIKNAARLLKKQWGNRQLFLPRRTPAPEYTGGRALAFNPGETNASLLATAMRRIIATFPKIERLAEATIAPVIALEEVVANLKARLQSSFRARWSDLTRTAGKSDKIVHFLAILELVRHGSISATQDKLFSDILLETEALGVPRY